MNAALFSMVALRRWLARCRSTLNEISYGPFVVNSRSLLPRRPFRSIDTLISTAQATGLHHLHFPVEGGELVSHSQSCKVVSSRWNSAEEIYFDAVAVTMCTSSGPRGSDQ